MRRKTESVWLALGLFCVVGALQPARAQERTRTTEQETEETKAKEKAKAKEERERAVARVSRTAVSSAARTQEPSTVPTEVRSTAVAPPPAREPGPQVVASKEALEARRAGVVDAKEIYRSASALEQSGDLEAAEQRLIEGKSSCGEGASSSACRASLDFSAGYLVEQRALREPARKQELLLQAAGLYTQSLEQDPNEPATLNNLALIYEELGRVDLAKDTLMRALEVDPAGGGTYALRLGDLASRQDDLDQAQQFYEEAALRSPDAETPRRRIVATYLRRETQDAPAILALAERWTERFPRVARSCYEAVLRSATPEQGRERNEAAVSWVELMARDGRLHRRSLESLGVDSSEEPWAAELSRYVGDPTTPLDEGWWLAEPRRRSVLGEVALSLGREAANRGRPDEAEAIWQAGLAMAPPFDAYSSRALRDQRFVPLDLGLELALLYFAESVDDSQRKFARLEDELFVAKGEAYRSGDLVTIQRFHTVLGRLYARMDRWVEGPFDARNAKFQLEHVLSTADRRRKESGFHQALATEQELLAGYHARRGERDEAIDDLIAATLSHLDADSLGRAESSLGRLVELGVASGAATELRGIVALRRRSRRLVDSDRGLDAETGAAILGEPWVTGSTRSELPSDFLERQRFKVRAEVVAGWWRHGIERANALGLAADLLDRLLEESVQLVGARDRARVESMLGIVAEATGVAGVEVEVENRPPAEQRQPDVLVLQLPGDPEAKFLRLDPVVVASARVVRALGADRVLESRVRLARRGRAATLVSLGDLEDEDQDAALERLATIPDLFLPR